MKKITRGMENGAEAINDNFQNLYLIGDIHMSLSPSNPSDRFGGTWERFGQGRMLVGVDENDAALNLAGKTGGSKNPLTAHEHSLTITTYRSGTSGTTNNITRSPDSGNAVTKEPVGTNKANSVGNNSNHNNWSPFVAVYMWVRTA